MISSRGVFLKRIKGIYIHPLSALQADFLLENDIVTVTEKWGLEVGRLPGGGRRRLLRGSMHFMPKNKTFFSAADTNTYDSLTLGHN